MTYDQEIQAVKDALKYLIAEGIAVEDGEGLYRLKTKKELKAEMEALINE